MHIKIFFGNGVLESKVFIATQGYIRILIMGFSIISVWSLSSSCISYYLFIDRKRRQKTDSRDT